MTLQLLLWAIVLSPIFVAYIIGSFPTAYLVSKIRGVDIFKRGSGNPGFTNSWRQLGFFWALPVLIVDVLKGYIACQIDEPAPDLFWLLPISVLIGHIFPLWTKFRGGKGTATVLGIIIALFPVQLPWVLVIFAILFVVSRIMSLSVLVSAFCLPFIVAFTSIQYPRLELSILIVLVLFSTHWRNILRLMDGEEKKIW